MYTVVQEVDGSKNTIVTKQYEVGTYVIINNDPSLQFNVDKKEEDYHFSIRKKALKEGAKIIGGTIINRRSKYKINPDSSTGDNA